MNNKNILIQLSHPAHFHLYKNVAAILMKDGYNVFIVIKTKDILEDLLKESGLPYYNILRVPHRRSKLGMLMDTFIPSDIYASSICGGMEVGIQMGILFQPVFFVGFYPVTLSFFVSYFIHLK